MFYRLFEHITIACANKLSISFILGTNTKKITRILKYSQ